MSVKVSSWVWHDTPDEVKGNRLIALLALADIADDEGVCRFAEDTSQRALAAKSRMAVSTFREATDWLEEHGYLESSRANQTATKEYRIVVSAGIRRSDGAPESGGQGADSRRSDRRVSAVTAPESGGHSSYRRIDVADVEDVVPRKRDDEAFERVWASWPSSRRGARKKAESSWRTAVKVVGRGSEPKLVAKVEQVGAIYATWAPAELQYVPHLTTWLNQERWTMPLPEVNRGRARSTVAVAQDAAAILAQRRAAREQKAIGA